ncbi:(2Fe-2S)-binding protein [Novosphingobium endophyticum]|uniref:(2Fe-2S)-binding protein n=1 Tax=Novosphingobium endophyticum TaxID=1955250 RepID=A0A916TVB9_9SPHN|nr:aromatic ring-hydroxylating dioxygenase subunit alpha [Novosphingobium endophyticum]GGC03236.1 (2Fe-2S)-binding protein [Novosphingobium endophyticum]
MNEISNVAAVGAVTPDRVPIDAYISPEYVRLEKERLWPRIWQMACREEEIPQPGDFYTYDIADESITVVRKQDGTVAAYHNVCPHRGRRLTAGCGRMGRFHCKYHGWQFDLDGKPAHIVDHKDWGDLLPEAEVSLYPVKVGLWGGWVFINMDPDSESLERFLGEAQTILDPFEIQHMRYVWRKRIVMQCNWKVAQEAFMEGYHVQTTHRQLLPYMDDYTYSRAYGKHAMFGYAPTALFGLPSPRLGNQGGDIRHGLYMFNKEIWETLKATSTEEMLAAGKRLMELPETATPLEVYIAFAQFHQEEAAKNGRPFPDITGEQLMAAGTDWNIFPNLVFLQQPTNVLFYRARPNGDNPDSCIFEINALERFAPGAEPANVEVDVGEDWRTVDWGLILSQDFQNMEEVQKGMKSCVMTHVRPSPLQEVEISNFHRAYHEYMREGA